MSKYLIVLPVEKTEGSYVGQLPLHCTLVLPFNTCTDPEKIGVLLRGTCVRYKPIWLVSDYVDTFMAHSAERVHVLRMHADLMRLHTEMVELLKMCNVEYVSPQWVGDGYRPHVTTTRRSSFPPGAEHLADTATLLIYEGIPESWRVSGSRKTVIGSYPLGG